MWVSAAAVFCEFAMLVSLSSPGLFRLALKALAPQNGKIIQWQRATRPAPPTP